MIKQTESVNMLHNEDFDYIKFECTFSDNMCSEYDVFIDNVKQGYVVEHIFHPISEEKLEKPVFEFYYDYDEENEEYSGSYICENLDELCEFIECEQ
jgi:hypothetical protein